MTHDFGLITSRASALVPMLASTSTAQQANLLLNPHFERIEPLGGAFGRPSDWLASAFSPVAGAVTATCPAALTPRARHRTGVAWLNDSLPSDTVPRPPAALYQTVTLGAGAYRFGGRLAVRIWDQALDAVGRRVLIGSQAYLRLYRGKVAFDPASRAPAGVDGTLLGSIDLSPQRFAFGDFRRPPSIGTTVRFAYLAFDIYEETFALDLAGPVEVTMQLVVLPVEPAGDAGADRLVPLTHLTVLADRVFLEPTVA